MKYHTNCFNSFSQILVSIFLLASVNCEESQRSPRVVLKISQRSILVGTNEQTGTGAPAGADASSNGRQYFAFRGIPYAEPPVNESRWQDPKLLELVKPQYDATNYGDQCIQWSHVQNKMVGNEDCLFLNVFTPKLPNIGLKDKPLLPVMVYIHGGGYVVGSSNAAGPNLFMKQDVVFVTFNYRLGAFGYLSTGSENLPGNYGSLDQIVALDWVQKYIEKFGGDRNSVTIFGHSAGGAAVHLLTLSPRALGKFHKAIVQSGSGLSPWVVQKNPKIYAQDFAKRIGCQSEISSPELIKCLKEKSAAELLDAQSYWVEFWSIPVTSNHVVDLESRGPNSFLPDLPENLVDKKLYQSVTILTGITADEGLMPYVFLHLALGDKFQDNEHFRNEIIPKIVRSVFPFGHSEDVRRVAEAVIEQYFPDEKEIGDQAKKISAVSDIFGDTLFNSGHWDMLQKYADHGHTKVYSYIFTHRTPQSPTTVWSQIKHLKKQRVEHPLLDSGVGHVDDMYYLFAPCEQLPSNPDFKMSQTDLEFADFMVGIFVAFAKNGNPAEGVQKRVGFHEWKPLQAGSVNYYNLTSVPAPMGTFFREKESIFWKGVYQSLGKHDNRPTDEL